jgi:hypothetical protein
MRRQSFEEFLNLVLQLAPLPRSMERFLERSDCVFNSSPRKNPRRPSAAEMSTVDSTKTFSISRNLSKLSAESPLNNSHPQYLVSRNSYTNFIMSILEDLSLDDHRRSAVLATLYTRIPITCIVSTLSYAAAIYFGIIDTFGCSTGIIVRKLITNFTLISLPYS